jgi:hypothetical protein
MEQPGVEPAPQLDAENFLPSVFVPVCGGRYFTHPTFCATLTAQTLSA